MLINLAEAALAKAQWPTEVKIGRYTFDLGEGPLNVVKASTSTGDDTKADVPYQSNL